MDNNQMFQEFEEAQEQSAPVTVEQLDQMVKDLREARRLAEEKAEDKKKADAMVDDIEATITDVLEALGKTSYECQGVGRVTKVTRLSYRVPKDPEAKSKLYEYIETKYGIHALDGMLSINSKTLTSWANREAEETGMVQIPGLEAPTSQDSISFRVAKDK